MLTPTDDLPEHYARALRSLARIATTYFDAGRADDALRLLDYAERLAAETDIPPEAAAALLIESGRIRISWASFSTNQYDHALGVLRRAEELIRQLGEPALLAGVLHELGRLFYQQSLTAGAADFDTAAGYFGQALLLREAAGDEQGRCESLFHVGLVAERRRRFDEALAHFEEVRAVAERNGFTGVLAEALRHLAFARLRAGEQELALDYFERSLALLEQAGSRLVLPFARLSVADTLAAAEPEAALAIYQVARDEAEQMHVRRALVQILYSLGELYEAGGDGVRARELYQRSYDLARSMAFALGVAMCEQKLAGLGDSENQPGTP